VQHTRDVVGVLETSKADEARQELVEVVVVGLGAA
jgi:hypothetical protein